MQVSHTFFALIEPDVIENVRINLAQKVDEFDVTFVFPSMPNHRLTLCDSPSKSAILRSLVEPHGPV